MRRAPLRSPQLSGMQRLRLNPVPILAKEVDRSCCYPCCTEQDEPNDQVSVSGWRDVASIGVLHSNNRAMRALPSLLHGKVSRPW